MNHDDPILKKKKKKNARNRKSESAKLDPEDVGNAYGIDHLKIGEAKHDLYDSKLILAQRRIFHMENKINNDKSLTHECNVLTNIFNPIKRAKSKNSNYSQILQGNLEFFELYWIAEAVQQL